LVVEAAETWVETFADNNRVGPVERFCMIRTVDNPEPKTWSALSNAEEAVPLSKVAYAHRQRHWQELFLRWYKCILGRRHLLVESPNGVTIHVDVALIVSLLLSLWVGKKPTKRTFEMFCLCFAGWATEAELWAPVPKLHHSPNDSS